MPLFNCSHNCVCNYVHNISYCFWLYLYIFIVMLKIILNSEFLRHLPCLCNLHCLCGITPLSFFLIAECIPDTTRGPWGQVFWPPTSHNSISILPCPLGANSVDVEGDVSRRCAIIDGFAEWEDPNYSQCRQV